MEFCDPEQAERIRIVDAPLVEGAIAAAVAAEGGGRPGCGGRGGAVGRGQFAAAAERAPDGRRRRPPPTPGGRRRRRWSPCATRSVCTPDRRRNWCARSRAGTPRCGSAGRTARGRPALGARRGRAGPARWRPGADPGHRRRRRRRAGRSGAADRGRLRRAGRPAAAGPSTASPPAAAARDHADGRCPARHPRGGRPGDRYRSAGWPDLPDTLPPVAGADPASRDHDCPRPSPRRRTGWPPAGSSPRPMPRWWPTPNCAGRPTSTWPTVPRPPGGRRCPRRPLRVAASPDELVAARAVDLREAGAEVLADLGVGHRPGAGATCAGTSWWPTISGRPRCRCCSTAGPSRRCWPADRPPRTR